MSRITQLKAYTKNKFFEISKYIFTSVFQFFDDVSDKRTQVCSKCNPFIE